MGIGMTYIPLPQKEKGGQKELWTSDMEVHEVLLAILEKLGQIELHLSIITDEEIKEGETK